MKLIYLRLRNISSGTGGYSSAGNAEQDGSVQHTHELPCARA